MTHNTIKATVFGTPTSGDKPASTASEHFTIEYNGHIFSPEAVRLALSDYVLNHRTRTPPASPVVPQDPMAEALRQGEELRTLLESQLDAYDSPELTKAKDQAKIRLSQALQHADSPDGHRRYHSEAVEFIDEMITIRLTDLINLTAETLKKVREET